jgi:transcriptional regulator with XRE-family HTH domain
LQIAALREKAGLSQKQLEKRLKTSQQQISRLESPSYEGRSLSMIRRVAEELGATVRVTLMSQPSDGILLAEPKANYRAGKTP